MKFRLYPNKSYLILPPPPALGSVRQDSDDPLTLAANVLQHLLYTLLATADRPSIPQKTLPSSVSNIGLCNQFMILKKNTINIR